MGLPAGSKAQTSGGGSQAEAPSRLTVFWNISFKVCNNACIMPTFGKNQFHQFLLSVLKINNTVNFDGNFFVHLEWLSNQNFPFKVCNTDCIMPGFDNSLLSAIFTRWFKGKLFRYH